jgi:hypothetical protein
MTSVSVKVVPGEGGEKLMMTDRDWPEDKLKEPPPLTTENGPVRVPILPSNKVGEVDELVMVRVCLAVCPTATLPKSTGVGLIDNWINSTPFPVKFIPQGDGVPQFEFEALWVMRRVA